MREAFRHSGFWLLNLGFLACGFQLAFIANHLPAYLRDKGMQPAEGMAALAIIALANIAGTYWFGVLGERHSRKYLLANGIYLVRTAAMALFVLLPLSAATLYGFAAVMGFLWLGTVPLTSGIVSSRSSACAISPRCSASCSSAANWGRSSRVWLGGVVFEDHPLL